MNSVEYRRQSVNSTGSFHFSHINLKNDDIKTIFLISSQYNAKGTLFKKKMLKEQSSLMLPWLDLSNILKKKSDMTYEEIKTCMEESDEEVSLLDP